MFGSPISASICSASVELWVVPGRTTDRRPGRGRRRRSPGCADGSLRLAATSLGNTERHAFSVNRSVNPSWYVVTWWESVSRLVPGRVRRVRGGVQVLVQHGLEQTPVDAPRLPCGAALAGADGDVAALSDPTPHAIDQPQSALSLGGGHPHSGAVLLARWPGPEPSGPSSGRSAGSRWPGTRRHPRRSCAPDCTVRHRGVSTLVDEVPRHVDRITRDGGAVGRGCRRRR